MGALLIDMNGTEVKLWKGLQGFPNKMLPGGYVLGYSGERNTRYGMQDFIDLVQVDWDGNVVWKFNEYEFIEDSGEDPQWMARSHHDYQRQGNPLGYFVAIDTYLTGLCAILWRYSVGIGSAPRVWVVIDERN